MIFQTLAKPWAHLAICLFSMFSHCSHVFSVGSDVSQEPESEKPSPIVIKLADPTFQTVHVSSDIGAIERGKTTTIPLRLENGLGSDVTFNNIIVQCACTGAKFPSELIKHGQSVDGDVALTVSKTERSLNKVFSFEIKSQGSVERILVDLKANVKNVTTFSQELYSISVHSDLLEREKTISVTLPFIASPEISLDDLRVTVSGELYDKARKSIAAEFRPISELRTKGAVGSVVVNMDSSVVSSESEYFAVHVEGHYFSVATAQVVLRKIPPVSLVPQVLYFSSTDLTNVQAFGILRTETKLDASSLKLISTKLDSGDAIESKLLPSGNSVARIELTCSKVQASKWKDEARTLEIIVESNGKEYSTKARCQFQW